MRRLLLLLLILFCLEIDGAITILLYVSPKLRYYVYTHVRRAQRLLLLFIFYTASYMCIYIYIHTPILCT